MSIKSEKSIKTKTHTHIKTKMNIYHKNHKLGYFGLYVKGKFVICLKRKDSTHLLNFAMDNGAKLKDITILFRSLY